MGTRYYDISLTADNVHILLYKANNIYGGNFIILKEELKDRIYYINTAEIIGTEYRGNSIEIQIRVIEEDKKSDFYGTNLIFIVNCDLNRAEYTKLFKKWDGKIKYSTDRYRTLGY